MQWCLQVICVIACVCLATVWLPASTRCTNKGALCRKAGTPSQVYHAMGKDKMYISFPDKSLLEDIAPKLSF